MCSTSPSWAPAEPLPSKAASCPSWRREPSDCCWPENKYIKNKLSLGRIVLKPNKKSQEEEEEEEEEEDLYVITTAVSPCLKLREMPTRNSEEKGKICSGEKVRILECIDKEKTVQGRTGEWCRVQIIHNNKTGYAFGGFLRKI